MPEWLNAALAVVGATVGAYAAVRAKLAALEERVSHAAQAATRAHERIDGLLSRKGVSR